MKNKADKASKMKTKQDKEDPEYCTVLQATPKKIDPLQSGWGPGLKLRPLKATSMMNPFTETRTCPLHSPLAKRKCAKAAKAEKSELLTLPVSCLYAPSPRYSRSGPIGPT